jgi:hypothetical protein
MLQPEERPSHRLALLRKSPAPVSQLHSTLLFWLRQEHLSHHARPRVRPQQADRQYLESMPQERQRDGRSGSDRGRGRGR